MADDELVESVSIAVPGDGASSLYLKAMDRKVWAFALVGVAATGTVADGRFESLGLAASGVANVPHRLDAAAKVLTGGELTDARIAEAADAAVADASPTEANAYKVDLLRRLVADAARRLAAG